MRVVVGEADGGGSVAAAQAVGQHPGEVLLQHRRRSIDAGDVTVRRIEQRVDPGPHAHFQHAIAPWREHHVTWGAGYRVSAGRITAVAPSAFFPDRRTDQLFSKPKSEETADYISGRFG